MKKALISLLCTTLFLGICIERSSQGQSPMANPPAPGSPALDPSLGIVTLPLWSGSIPRSTSASIDIPTLTVFLPHSGRANGTSVVVAPGGAYLGLASNLEGRQVADWFTARGVTAFVLKYRLGKDNLYPIPLLDAQRAVRLVRSFDKQYGLSPSRVGMVGFRLAPILPR